MPSVCVADLMCVISHKYKNLRKLTNINKPTTRSCKFLIDDLKNFALSHALFKDKDLASESSDLEEHLRTPGADGSEPLTAAEQRDEGLKLILRTREIETPQPQHRRTDNTNHNRLTPEHPHSLSLYLRIYTLILVLVVFLFFYLYLVILLILLAI